MRLLKGLLNVGNVVLHSSIGGVKLRGFLVCLKRTAQVSLSVQCGTLSAPSFRPVWFEFSGLVGIFQGVFVVSLGGVGGRAVAVENVIVWRQSDGLREFFTAFKGQLLVLNM